MKKAVKKTIREVPKQEYFMKDKDFFLLWRLSKASFLPKKWWQSVKDLSPWFEYSQREGFREVCFHTEVDNRFTLWLYTGFEFKSNLTQESPDLKKYIQEDRKRIVETMRRIESRNFTTKDVLFVDPLLSDDFFRSLYMLSKEGVVQDDLELKSRLDDYIQDFINGELLIEDLNYFNFQKQKELFIKLIRDMKAFEQYGKNFIVSDEDFWTPFYDNYSSLFIHTIYAIEFLWYIEVLSVSSYLDWWKARYAINIMPDESFKKLIYEDYRKENPKTVIEGYDEKKCVLSFAGKKIPISKTGKETDATQLLKTLLQAKDDEYIPNDEILEEWWYRSQEEQAKSPRNKIYHAGQAINRTMQIKAGIDDFIDVNTTKARINPKYRSL